MHSGDHDCTPCPLATRRTFLRRTAAQLGSTLALLGISTDLVHALSAGVSRPILEITTDTTTKAGDDIKRYVLPEADGVQIDREHGIILVRWLKSVFAFSLRCPHQNTSLQWIASDEHFQCPKHRSQYAADGDYMSGRATRGMDRYEIRREGKTILVNQAVLYDQSKDEKAWTAAAVAL